MIGYCSLRKFVTFAYVACVTYITFGICKQLLSKNSIIPRLGLLDYGTADLQISTHWLRSSKIASPGYSHTSDRVRYFDNNRRKFKFTKPGVSIFDRFTSLETQQNERNCTKWAVVRAANHGPSEAVRRMLYLINRPTSAWCMVIVGDLESPSSPYEFVTTLADHQNVVYLNEDEQNKFSHDSMKMGASFVASLPWHSFGRKNIGFAYAISQKPKPTFIWDFDDNNQLKFWVDHANVKDLQSLDNLVILLSSQENVLEVVTINTTSYRRSHQLTTINLKTKPGIPDGEDNLDTVFNPYPILGCPLTKCWPRGFPISHIEQTDFSAAGRSLDTWLVPTHHVKSGSISIVQSVADHNPDIDAIIRLKVKNQPFSFDQNKNKVKNADKLLLIPKGLVVPMNAQATLHAQFAFFALYLPWTVNGRVSDIWRSYIAQAILSLTDHTVAFAPLSLVDQDRNDDPGPRADYDAERQLYQQTDALLSYLSDWKSRHQKKFIGSAGSHKLTTSDYFTQNFAALMEDLYVDLYERRFVEEGDVISVQYWLQMLLCYGYIQPSKAQHCQNSSWNNGTQPVLMDEKLEHFAQLGNSESDFTVSTCPPSGSTPTATSTKLTFLSTDIHRATRLDLSTLLASLGHKTILFSLPAQKNYPQVFSRKYSASRKVLVELSEAVSNVVNRSQHEIEQAYISGSDIVENLKFYTNTPEGKKLMDQIDVITSTYPPTLFKMFLPFLQPQNQVRNRSAIIALSHRYNMGHCTVKAWKELNDIIKKLLSSTASKNIVGAMSRYDLEYMHHYTGIKKAPNGYTSMVNGRTHESKNGDNIVLHLLPAITYFYVRPEVGQEIESLRKRNTLLIFNLERAPAAFTFSKELKLTFDSLKDRDIHAISVREAHKFYELSDLVQYGAILYFPYSVMSNKFVEFYSLNIPMMVPSLRFFKYHAPFGDDRTVTSGMLCKNHTLGLDMEKSPNSAHQYNPNIMSNSGLRVEGIDNKQHELYWLQFADFFDFPHVTYFDNASHAADLFVKFAIDDEGLHFSNIKKLMEKENKMRRYFDLVKAWCPILADVTRSLHIAS